MHHSSFHCAPDSDPLVLSAELPYIFALQPFEVPILSTKHAKVVQLRVCQTLEKMIICIVITRQLLRRTKQKVGMSLRRYLSIFCCCYI